LIATALLPSQESGGATELLDTLNHACARLDERLTDIMLAQDFHDLTGQVVAKVVVIATELEENLVKLLLQAAPVELQPEQLSGGLEGPVIGNTGRCDIAATQGEVDDLLASLGF
jgi:chemotaxis protein CheZ